MDCRLMSIKKTHQQYTDQLKLLGTGVYPIQEYQGAHFSILHGSVHCDHTWRMKPNTVISMKCVCPTCSRTLMGINKRTSTKQYKKQISGTRIRLIDLYSGTMTKVFHKCLDCKTKWKVRPNNILNGSKCPICSQRARKDRMFIKTMTYNETFFRHQGYEDLAIKELCNSGIDIKTIITNIDRNLPVIRYEFDGKQRWHFPDIGIKETKVLIEVKSVYTLCRTESVFSRNKAKARTAVSQGFDYRLMLFDGIKRIPTSETWYNMTLEEFHRSLPP